MKTLKTYEGFQDIINSWHAINNINKNKKTTEPNIEIYDGEDKDLRNFIMDIVDSEYPSYEDMNHDERSTLIYKVIKEHIKDFARYANKQPDEIEQWVYGFLWDYIVNEEG